MPDTWNDESDPGYASRITTYYQPGTLIPVNDVHHGRNDDSDERHDEPPTLQELQKACDEANTTIRALRIEVSRLRGELKNLEIHERDLRAKNTRLGETELATTNKKLVERNEELLKLANAFELQLKQEKDRWKVFPKFTSGSRTHMDELLADLNEVSLKSF